MLNQVQDPLSRRSYEGAYGVSSPLRLTVLTAKSEDHATTPQHLHVRLKSTGTSFQRKIPRSLFLTCSFSYPVLFSFEHLLLNGKTVDFTYTYGLYHRKDNSDGCENVSLAGMIFVSYRIIVFLTLEELDITKSASKDFGEDHLYAVIYFNFTVKNSTLSLSCQTLNHSRNC